MHVGYEAMHAMLGERGEGGDETLLYILSLGLNSIDYLISKAEWT